MNKRKTIIINIILICFFIAISFISNSLLFKTHYLFGAGDMQFHLKRIIELEKSFSKGQIYPNFSFNEFHGSAVMTLYPYINLIPIVFLSYFIKSNFILIYIFLGINIFLSLVISYYSSFNLNKSIKISLLFSIIYSLSVPFLTYEFYDMDLGVVTSIAALPLIIFGLVNLLNNNKWLEFSIGVIIVIFSHVLSIAIILLFILIWLLINFKSINLKIVKSLFKSILLVLLITSIVWVPALYISINNINNIMPPSPAQMQGTKMFVLFINGLQGNISYGLSAFALLGMIAPIFVYKHLNKFVKQMYYISIALVIICSAWFPWGITNHSIFQIFKIFQYTWRFYIIPEILLSYVFSVCIYEIFYKIKFKNLIIAILILLTIILQIRGQYKIIHESMQSPTITQRYINTHRYIRLLHLTYVRSNNHGFGIHRIIIPIKSCYLPLRNQTYYKTPGYPYYKINNNSQLSKFVNINTNQNNPDYYPINSLKVLNYVNNNRGVDSYHHIITIHKNGFNNFTFYNGRHINTLSLPILHYSKENLYIYLNHHKVHYNVNKNDLITIHNIKKGNNNLFIRYIPNVWVKYIVLLLFIIGASWVLFIMLFNKINLYNKLK